MSNAGFKKKGRYIKAYVKAAAIARASSDKKALDVVTIDMRKRPSVCDYFVIASGTSTTQVRAIADNIIRKMDEKGERLWNKEGEREALWILLDYSDVVAHIFLDRTRRFYELERLWSDAPLTGFKEKGPGRRPKAAKKRRAKKGVGSAGRARKAGSAARPGSRKRR